MAVLEVESKITHHLHELAATKWWKNERKSREKREKKVPINAFNYDRDDVEQALASKHEVFAAKLERAKETAKEYVLLRKKHNIQAAQQEQDKEFKSILKEGHRAKTRAVNTLLAAGGTQGNLMDMELAQHDSKSSLNPGTAMPPPSQIASPLDTKMKVSPSIQGTTLNVEALGLPMIQ